MRIPKGTLFRNITRPVHNTADVLHVAVADLFQKRGGPTAAAAGAAVDEDGGVHILRQALFRGQDL